MKDNAYYKELIKNDCVIVRNDGVVMQNELGDYKIYSPNCPTLYNEIERLEKFAKKIGANYTYHFTRYTHLPIEQQRTK